MYLYKATKKCHTSTKGVVPISVLFEIKDKSNIGKVMNTLVLDKVFPYLCITEDTNETCEVLISVIEFAGDKTIAEVNMVYYSLLLEREDLKEVLALVGAK